MNTTAVINGEVQINDWVIAAPNNEYRFLIGRVSAIDILGTSEHETENLTDDVHIDFSAFDYTPQRINEIEEWFRTLTNDEVSFEALSLDDVIMSPKMLIRISDLRHEEILLLGNLYQRCEAFCRAVNFS